MIIKAIAERIEWMKKNRDCKHLCICCKYFDICKGSEMAAEELSKGEKDNEHEVRT